MIASYILIIVGIIFLVLFCVTRNKNGSIISLLFKTLTSLTFVALAILNKFLSRSEHPSQLFFIFGLVLGLIGDIFLDLKIYLKSRDFSKDSNNATYIGIYSFGLGHIFYMTGILLYGFAGNYGIFVCLVIALLLSLILYIVTKKAMKFEYGNFKNSIIIYSTLLIAFTLSSLYSFIRCGSEYPGILILFIGSVFFLISDLLLSFIYFSSPDKYLLPGNKNPESKLLIVLNHVTYYIGQFLIALSLLYLF